MIWDLLILKILDSRPGGEALTSELARELATLDANARQSLPRSPPIEGGIFGTGFVTSPRRGVWRISGEGRQYLRSIEPARASGVVETLPGVAVVEREPEID